MGTDDTAIDEINILIHPDEGLAEVEESSQLKRLLVQPLIAAVGRTIENIPSYIDSALAKQSYLGKSPPTILG
jgi:hypothetical protein